MDFLTVHAAYYNMQLNMDPLSLIVQSQISIYC